jgi:exosortase C (VPDSG-CTERM-specific)
MANRFCACWKITSNVPQQINSPATLSEPVTPLPIATVSGFRLRVARFAVWVALLLLCFHRPLMMLAGFAFHSELYSYLLLVPFISTHLIWMDRRELIFPQHLNSAPAAVPVLLGFMVLAIGWLALRRGWTPPLQDFLAWLSSAFVLLLLGGFLLFFGYQTCRRVAFPLCFLAFLIPFPAYVEALLQALLQKGSADCAFIFFKLCGTPVLFEGTQFQLPGFSLQVAPECSGIHSSLVLFLTSLLAGHLLLKSPRNRAVLAVAVFPLALLRNAVRIAIIGELCIHVSPDMINSYIHKHGGPFFFVLSLVPLFLLLLFLRKFETRNLSAAKPHAAS